MSSVPELTAKARKHWAKWLPKKTARLKAAGRWEAETQDAAVTAQIEIEDLMQQGYQEHEAEEVVLRRRILLEPESANAGISAREREQREEMAMTEQWLREQTQSRGGD